jgi:hypothetical protein
MRKEVEDFVRAGGLPSSEAPQDDIEQAELLLLRISAPVSEEEATLLLGAFGADDCYGLAWALLHLIETSPHAVPSSVPSLGANPWVVELWERQQRVT